MISRLIVTVGVLKTNGASPVVCRFLRVADQQPEACALLFAFSKKARFIPDARMIALQERLLIARGVPPATDLGNHLSYAFIVVLAGADLACACILEKVGKAELLTIAGLALPDWLSRRT